MALYVIYKNTPTDLAQRSIELHLGAGKISRTASILGSTLVAIQADGDELDVIKDKIRNIPMSVNAPIVIWHGPFAEFLYNNLYL